MRSYDVNVCGNAARRAAIIHRAIYTVARDAGCEKGRAWGDPPSRAADFRSFRSFRSFGANTFAPRSLSSHSCGTPVTSTAGRTRVRFRVQSCWPIWFPKRKTQPNQVKSSQTKSNPVKPYPTKSNQSPSIGVLHNPTHARNRKVAGRPQQNGISPQPNDCS